MPADPIELAKHVVKNLRSFTRPALPERPQFELTDAEILRLLEKYERGFALTTSDKESIALFAQWRASVCRLETVAAGHAAAVLHAIAAVEQTGTKATKLRAFIAEQFGRTLPDPLPSVPIHIIAERLAYDDKLLPKWLRTGNLRDAPSDVRQKALAAKRKRDQAAGSRGGVQ